MSRHFLFVALVVAALAPRAAAAQGQPTMYGPSIVAEQAKTVAAAAIAEAKKNQWTMAIAIVDTAGDLVYFERMDHTQVGSVDVAQAKARAAARFKRPTKAYQDTLEQRGKVIASFARRRDAIADALRAAAERQGGAIAEDPALLDEVTALVEFPAVYAGRFDPAFLAVPLALAIKEDPVRPTPRPAPAGLPATAA